MSPVVFYILLLSFVSGVGVATFVSVAWSTICWLFVVAAGLGAIVRRAPAGSAASVLMYLSIALIAGTLGMVRMGWATQHDGTSPLATLVGSDTTLIGVINAEPDTRERTQHLYVQTETDVVLVFADRLDTVAYGDRVKISGALRAPEPFATDLGRTFNYPGYLRAQGVEYILFRPTITVLESGHGHWFLTYLYNFKHAFMAALERVLSEPQVGLGEGLLLGVKQALGAELELVFRQTGIIHIVVLSGYNVMLVVAFVMFVFSAFLSLRWRVISGICAIACFALLVGLSATVVRASIMAGIFLIAHALGRRYVIMRALVFAGAVMVVLNPHILVYDVGFQLSFLATLGLIIIAPHFETLLMTVPNRFSAREFFVATVATQIAVLPLLLYQIGELSIVSVIVNVLVLPMVPIAMLTTFIAGLTAMFLPYLAPIPAVVAYWSLEYIIVVARFFAGVPFAAVTVPEFPFLVVPVAYLALGWGVWWLQNVLSARSSAIGKHAEESVVDDWEIVMEGDVVKDVPTNKHKSGADHRPAPFPAQSSPDAELPIFFR